MSTYSFIDPTFDSTTVRIYSYFCEYFSNPRLRRIKENDSCYIYACKVKSYLGKNKRYIFVFVKKWRVKKDDEYIFLDKLEWEILQTRTMEDVFITPEHNYGEINLPENNYKIHLTKTEGDKTFYKCDSFPQLLVGLISTPNQSRPYSPIGTLKLAIENYNSIFTFV
jgi:hypothetical protein